MKKLIGIAIISLYAGILQAELTKINESDFKSDALVEFAKPSAQGKRPSIGGMLKQNRLFIAKISKNQAGNHYYSFESDEDILTLNKIALEFGSNLHCYYFDKATISRKKTQILA